MKRVFYFGWLAIVWFLGGCSLLPAALAANAQELPTPTNYSFFNSTIVPLSTPDLNQPAGGTPTIARFFSPHATATPMMLPTSVPFSDVAATVTTPSQEMTVSVYDDQLSPNWSLAAAPGMQFDQANSTHVHGGSFSISMTPKDRFQQAQFFRQSKSNGSLPARSGASDQFLVKQRKRYGCPERFICIPFRQQRLPILGGER